MPKGFKHYNKREKRRVIKLKKTIYGLHQIPRAFWNYLTKKLIASGMIFSNLDTFFFIGDKVICIVYVDNLIFREKDESDIHDLEMRLIDLGLHIEQEEDTAGFMGVNL